MIPTGGKNLFVGLMGEAFYKLHPAIQHRLNRELYENKPVHFRGTLRVNASLMGRLIGSLAAFSGGVCAYTGDQVVCDVIAYHEPDSFDMFKERIYHFKQRDFHFKTRGHFLPRPGGDSFQLFEYCKFGLGLKLKMVEINGNLQFQADQYFWETPFGLLDLPLFLTPGKLTIDHQFVSETAFYFKYSMIHPWFGEVYYQEGQFVEMAEEHLSEVKTMYVTEALIRSQAAVTKE